MCTLRVESSTEKCSQIHSSLCFHCGSVKPVSDYLDLSQTVPCWDLEFEGICPIKSFKVLEFDV